MELATAKSHSSVALIVGVTGMAGLSLAEALKNPAALGGPWKVYGSAKRPKPSWFPSSITDSYIIFDATNIHDTTLKLAPIAAEITHVFWVALQVNETEEVNVQVNKTMLENVISVIRSAPDSRLTHISLQTGTQYYMGPVHFDSKSRKPHDPPFQEDFPRLPYPNFYYPLEDLVASHAPPLTYSIHRATIIIGASSRSVYNTLLTLAVYAAVCQRVGASFRYPGTWYTWEHFCDMIDANVLADQHIWASLTSQAHNKAFNCTNGDVFTWKSVWKVMSEVFEVEFVEFKDNDEEFDMVEFMKDKGKVWDEIVEENGLYPSKMEEITCFGALQSVLHFKIQHVSSMNKSRELGFFGFANTLKRFEFWVAKLKDMKIIPRGSRV